MKLFNNIPRGLVVFLVGGAVVIALIAGYELLAGGGGGATRAGSPNGFFSALFPFGGGASGGAGGGSAASSTPLSGTPSGQVPLLREVSADPVSGAWFVATGTESAPIIRYMTRENGYVSETPANSFAVARVSNTTLPGVEELYPLGDATLILRSLGDAGNIVNALGVVNATSSERSLSTTPLPPFARVAVERGVALIVAENGGSAVERFALDARHPSQTSKPVTLFTSPVSSWVPLLGGGRAFIETAPTAFSPGYLYEIKDGALREVAGGALGLTAIVSPSGRYAAVSGNGANGFSLFVVDAKNNATLPTPVRATTLKCAWVPPQEPLLFCAVPAAPPAGTYPDDWLSGSVSFADQAWLIDPEKNTAYYIGDLADESEKSLDAENVSVDASGSYALFMNKNDLSLWSLDIASAVAHATER